MNEDLDINLPPDADDLSRHAPALFKLKGAETGLVVPALYFEELSELIISKTAIPQESGLVVPENYFEDRVGRIVTLARFDSSLFDFGSAQSDKDSAQSGKNSAQSDRDRGFISPENYFEELYDQLEAQITLEDALPKTEGEVPEGYFDQMQKELHAHIALDNLKQDAGFVLPGNYFTEFTGRILAETSLSKEELHGDEIPEGYFEALPEKVIARINSEKGEKNGRVVQLWAWNRRTISVAASVALLLVLGWIFLNDSATGNGELMVSNSSALTPEPIPSVTPIVPQPVTETEIAQEIPKKREVVKPNTTREVQMKNEEIIAQSDLMDESLVIEFMTESEVLEPTEEVLNEEMMEYLMNDNAGLEVFDPGNK